MSNVVFMLLKDQICIYRLYHNHIVEILDRFHTFSATEIPLAFMMYENFVKLTDAFKVKGKKLILMFNLSLVLPEFYEASSEHVEELRQIIEIFGTDEP